MSRYDDCERTYKLMKAALKQVMFWDTEVQEHHCGDGNNIFKSHEYAENQRNMARETHNEYRQRFKNSGWYCWMMFGNADDEYEFPEEKRERYLRKETERNLALQKKRIKKLKEKELLQQWGQNSD